jgi:hypothetical protein
MRAFGDECLEALTRLRDRVGPRNAERIESVRARGFGQGLFEGGWIAQKSRSA